MEQKAAAETQHPETAAYDPPPQLDAALAEIALVEAKKTPKTIGYLTNYSFHIWYQIVIEILKRRGAQYGAEIVIKDANLSVENQIAQAREMLPRVDALILTPAATEGLEEILKLAKDAGKPVAVEANPVLCRHIAQRFEAEIATGALAIEKLFIGKPAFNYNTVVFIFYKSKMIVLFNKLG